MSELTYTQVKRLLNVIGPEKNCLYGYYGSYMALIAALYPVAYNRDFGGYPGETVVVVSKPDAVGLLLYTYGTCTVCDALQSCETRREVVALMADFNKRIRWFPALEAAADFLESEDAPLVEAFERANLLTAAADIRAGRLGTQYDEDDWRAPHNRR